MAYATRPIKEVMRIFPRNARYDHRKNLLLHLMNDSITQIRFAVFGAHLAAGIDFTTKDEGPTLSQLYPQPIHNICLRGPFLLTGAQVSVSI